MTIPPFTRPGGTTRIEGHWFQREHARFIEAAFWLFFVERIWPLVRLPCVEAALRSKLRSGLLSDQDRRSSSQ